MKTAFLILGAQRSGTSVTSHMLSRFQVSFGDDNHFLQDHHNPIFFELKWVNQYNNRLIKSLGYKYTDFFLPLETDFEHPNTLKIAAELPSLIQREWKDEQQIGIKDPRISLTFPVWRSALLAEGYTLKIIFVFRSPNSFLCSNQKLFQNWEGWDDERHLNFWLQLNLAAIYFTRGLPICFVNYDNLMAQPLEVAQQLADYFDLEQERVTAAASIVDQAHYHHKQISQDDSSIEHYYNLLCTYRLSATDYLSYRSRVLEKVQ
jgi:hypothetical protein